MSASESFCFLWACIRTSAGPLQDWWKRFWRMKVTPSRLLTRTSIPRGVRRSVASSCWKDIRCGPANLNHHRVMRKHGRRQEFHAYAPGQQTSYCTALMHCPALLCSAILHRLVTEAVNSLRTTEELCIRQLKTVVENLKRFEAWSKTRDKGVSSESAVQLPSLALSYLCTCQRARTRGVYSRHATGIATPPGLCPAQFPNRLVLEAQVICGALQNNRSSSFHPSNLLESLCRTPINKYFKTGLHGVRPMCRRRCLSCLVRCDNPHHTTHR